MVVTSTTGEQFKLCEAAYLFNKAVMEKSLPVSHVLYEIVFNYMAEMYGCSDLVCPASNSLRSLGHHFLEGGGTQGTYQLLRGDVGKFESGGGAAAYAESHNIWLPGLRTITDDNGPCILDSGIIASDLAQGLLSCLSDTSARAIVGGHQRRRVYR